jgi:hypothetical protein
MIKRTPARLLVEPPIRNRKVNFSVFEAAMMFGYSVDQMLWLIHQKRIRCYSRPYWREPRLTILDLREYEYVSGRRLHTR